MAGQRPLADDHTWMGCMAAPHTHTCNIIILKHMHDADEASQASGRNIFSVSIVRKAHPNGLAAS